MSQLVSFLPVACAVPLALLGPLARRSTLAFAWSWACAALVAMASVEWASGSLVESSTPAWTPAARFAAGALSFCPFMSVLGSKRPHEQAWQWIVLSLWGILVLPAAEWLVLRRGVSLEIHGVRAWFLLVLIVVQATHALGTRAWFAGLSLAAAQTIFFAAWLPGFGGPLERWLLATCGEPTRHVAVWTCVGVSFAALRWSWRTRASRSPRDRVWLDFRDRFGTLWSLRVMERVQAAAHTERTPWRLHWNGFSASTDSPPGFPVSLDHALWNLLRRFVTPEWCAARGWQVPE